MATAVVPTKPSSPASYESIGKFNILTGKFERTGGDEYWNSTGVPLDRAGRQMSNFFNIEQLEENRAEAKRMKQARQRSTSINWKKVNAEKKVKKQKARNLWLFED
jgi:hypothetical protein